ncbi:MAG: chemotaxis protein CheD [Bacteroidota bacterium]
MIDRFSGLNIIYLQPGDFHITEKSEIVTTVLGSCLSVIMFSEKNSLSGICHSLLPRCTGDGSHCLMCPNAFKYVNCSIAIMVEIFERHGVKRDQIEVKVFGGAEMFSSDGYDRSVGKQNIQIAMEILANEKLRVTASDTGGIFGRKIYFVTHTGEVFMQKIKKTQQH